MNALMSLQPQISFLITCLLANVVKTSLLTEGAEEFLFMVMHKRAYLRLMKRNLSPETGPLGSAKQTCC